jgi:hypothetical protein
MQASHPASTINPLPRRKLHFEFTIVGSGQDHAGEETDNKESSFVVGHADLVGDEAIGEGASCDSRLFWSTWAIAKSWKSFPEQMAMGRRKTK